jgi:TonB-linked SusC/RagA family outer membrane protein
MKKIDIPKPLLQEKFWYRLSTIIVLIIAFVSLSGLSVYGQGNITVTGTISDTAGNKMPGVTIVAVGKTNIGTVTDVNGKFVLDVADNTTLKISAIGYDDQEVVATANNKVFNIVIKAKSGNLSEVVVTAFGRKERREAVVGSVTSVNPQDLKIPSSNLTTALAGRIAGMIAYQRNGQPGQDNASFFIRGVTTFGYKTDPLILVDNVELTPSDLARMQVDDIASFSILKDASATALYGARGANGVILITTKEGKEGKAKVHIRVENSISEPTQNIQLADPITYMKLYNEAITTRDPLGVPLFSQNKILNTKNHVNPYVYPAIDWLKELFKKRTNNQRVNFSVSGGGGVARYYIAGSFNQDNGVLKVNPVNDFNSNVKLQNYQLRSNVNIKITKSTEAVVRLSGTFDDYTGPITDDGSFATDLYYKALHASPVLFPAFFPPDSANRYTQHVLFGNSYAGGASTALYGNPYADLMKGYKNYSQSRMSAQFELNQDLSFIADGLSFSGIFNTNRYSYFDVTRQYKPFYYSIGSYDKLSGQYSLVWLNNEPDQATEYLDFVPGKKDITTFLYLQAVLNYAHDIGKSNISASLVATREQTLNADATDPDTNLPSLQYSLPYRNIGLAGRATYSYRAKYFLEFDFGYNGSERFSSNHRYGFFPTIGASWIVSKEKFWEPLSAVINRLKLRASYGLVGNDAIGSQRFFYLSEVNLNGGNPAAFGLENGYSRNGVSIGNYENRDVTWETSRQTNLAVEFTLLNDLNVVAEIYKQHRYNILQSRSDIPASMGLEAPISANVGQADSKGLDLSADYKRNFGQSGWISGRGNLTIAVNKFTAYEEPHYAEPWRYKVGQSVNQTFGYIAERLFVDDKEAANAPVQNFGDLPAMGGDIKYRDVNGDGQITERDLVPIGLPTVPQIVYGFGVSSGFKNFDLSAFLQGLARESFFIDPTKTSPFVNNTQLLKAYADSHWSEENQNLYATWPRLSTAIVNNNVQTSTWWMRDGTFLRLKSVELGYTLPATLTKRLSIDKVRIYLSGLNLLTWSGFGLWDPEMGGNGFAYPIQKVYNLGVDVNF